MESPQSHNQRKKNVQLTETAEVVEFINAELLGKSLTSIFYSLTDEFLAGGRHGLHIQASLFLPEKDLSLSETTILPERAAYIDCQLRGGNDLGAIFCTWQDSTIDAENRKRCEFRR